MDVQPDICSLFDIRGATAMSDGLLVPINMLQDQPQVVPAAKKTGAKRMIRRLKTFLDTKQANNSSQPVQSEYQGSRLPCYVFCICQQIKIKIQTS